MNIAEVIVHGHIWSRSRRDGYERWDLKIDGLDVWAKNYGSQVPGSAFIVWRCGRGGSPSRVQYQTRDGAMAGALELARRQANDRLEKALDQLVVAANAKRTLALADIEDVGDPGKVVER